MNHPTNSTISECFLRLVAGDNQAIGELWNNYFEQLSRVAKKQIGNVPRRAFDEEDVVVSVFECLRKGAQDGRFAEMLDRNELWKLLVTITRQKAIDRVRRELADKRGGGITRGESAFGETEQNVNYGINELLGDTPTPDSLVEMEEEKNRLLAILRDDSLRQVTVLRMQGYNQKEIADQLGVTSRTIQRKFDLIRNAWQSQLAARKS